jgi:hypothetical protein
MWFSLRDDMMYVRPVDGSGLFQIDTETGAVFVLVPAMALSVLPFKIHGVRHVAGRVALAEDRCPISPASPMSVSP